MLSHLTTGGNCSSNRDCLIHLLDGSNIHDPSIISPRHFAMNFPPGFQNCHELEVDQWDLESGVFFFLIGNSRSP